MPKSDHTENKSKVDKSSRRADQLNSADEARRQLLVRALAAGVFTASGAINPALAAGLFGSVPKPLPPGTSIYELSGEVLVNGSKANKQTRIEAGDTVETADDGRIVFVVGHDAFNLRSSSKMQITGSGLAVDTLRLVTGALLSVFGKSKHTLSTPVATIGIRGTGVYMETEAERSYVCTCYGVTQLQAIEDASSKELIRTKHHDKPRYIVAGAPPGEAIQFAPLKNHNDLELIVIEALVGRSPPFEFSFDKYRKKPRRY